MIDLGCFAVLSALLLVFHYLLRELPTVIQLIRATWRKQPEQLQQRYGHWAVITGPTDGIGKAYAFQLAARHINIVLIGRNLEKLQNVAAQLEETSKIETKIIVADFTKGRPIYSDIAKQLENIDVGLLINNVGIQYKHPMSIAELPEDEIWDNVNVNITSATMMTRIILPKLISKNKGAIVNLSSAASKQPQPYMNLYAASKAYVAYFSEALREEVKNTKITVQTLVPFYISSKINDFQPSLQKVNLFTPDVDTYAKYAIESLGQVDYTTGYWPHRIQFALFKIAPTWLRTKLIGIIYKGYRKDYLKRQLKQN